MSGGVANPAADIIPALGIPAAGNPAPDRHAPLLLLATTPVTPDVIRGPVALGAAREARSGVPDQVRGNDVCEVYPSIAAPEQAEKPAPTIQPVAASCKVAALNP